jgi:peptidoglycan-associated lipoprotein
LSSHTDSVGTHAYNIELSQRRAESSVNYLVQSGISPDRLVAKGYGEEKPIARNTNPDGTDNPRGRDKNRRTEFKILGVSDIPKRIEDE